MSKNVLILVTLILSHAYTMAQNGGDSITVSGKIIEALKDNQVFVFGSNPEGRHGMGAAKAAMKFGAKYGKGRGLSGQTYALVTKNLKAGFCESCTGIIYKDAGAKSVTEGQIVNNILELYFVARSMPDKEFLIPYQNSSKNIGNNNSKKFTSVHEQSFTMRNSI